MPARGDAALLLTLALAACDSAIKLEVVTAAKPARPGSGGNSAGTSTMSGNAGTLNRPDGGQGGGEAGASDGGAANGGAADGGAPAVGRPWEAEALYVASFASFAFPGEYLRHQDGDAWVGTIDPLTEADDGNFEVIPGLFDSECVSLRRGAQGSFLRHSHGRLTFGLADDTPLFFGDATFCPEPGLAEPTWISLRSINFPESYLYVNSLREIRIRKDDGSAAFAGAATFRVENPFQPSGLKTR